MWPHSQAYRPLRVEGSTYLLFPSPNSPPVVGPLDVQELSAVTHLPCICVTAATSLTTFLQATHIPSQHQRPPPGNCDKGNLSKLPSQAAALPLRESNQWVIIWGGGGGGPHANSVYESGFQGNKEYS